MKSAEKLARLIRSVTRIHTIYAASSPDAFILSTIESAIERACKAIGSGDEGAMVAVGLELEAITE